jgi:CRP-like cAMP-binding protein
MREVTVVAGPSPSPIHLPAGGGKSVVRPPARRPAASGNGLLDALARAERRHFMAEAAEIPLVPFEVLCEPGRPIGHVYFPTAGFISLAVMTGDAGRLDVGLVGCEGMVGTPLVLGLATSDVMALVQGAGSALRMEAAAFRRQLALCPALRETLDRYVYVRMSQLANAVACSRFHVVESRLASWLLTVQERTRSDECRITHENLAPILGVRRVGITKAAMSLQQLGLIRYCRGKVTILDHRGLVDASCGCHMADVKTHRLALAG